MAVPMQSQQEENGHSQNEQQQQQQQQHESNTSTDATVSQSDMQLHQMQNYVYAVRFNSFLSFPQCSHLGLYHYRLGIPNLRPVPTTYMEFLDDNEAQGVVSDGNSDLISFIVSSLRCDVLEIAFHIMDLIRATEQPMPSTRPYLLTAVGIKERMVNEAERVMNNVRSKALNINLIIGPLDMGESSTSFLNEVSLSYANDVGQEGRRFIQTVHNTINAVQDKINNAGPNSILDFTRKMYKYFLDNIAHFEEELTTEMCDIFGVDI